jgi:hypothetical protein
VAASAAKSAATELLALTAAAAWAVDAGLVMASLCPQAASTKLAQSIELQAKRWWRMVGFLRQIQLQN